MPTISETLVAAALATPNLDEAADALGRAVEGAYGATGASRGVKDFLNGTWLGHPLHPVVTDIPVGAWTVALVLDALGERRAAKIAVGIGLLGAVGAAVSGLTDWIDTYGKPRRLGVVHAAVNGTATAFYAASFFSRGRRERLATALSSIGYCLVSLGALYGGAISLDMQIGVNHARGIEPPETEVDVAALEEIPDGGMRRVEAEGYSVLLVRRGSDVSAIAAVCAHQGGPLEHGRLEGDVVTCPWHGSQCCVRDGGIVHGPTAYPQPAFDVRLEGGRVLIQARREG